MRIKKYILLAALIGLPAIIMAQTPRIKIVMKGLYPEGTAYNPANGNFYVSSVIDGTIGTVDAAGNYKKFYEDKNLKSTYGLQLDAKRNRLWVCVSDANYSNLSDSTTFKKLGKIIAIDLATGKKVADINLAKLYQGKHFINDMAMDKAGNLYVTDSFSPVIYKVDAAGKASIFAQNNLWMGEDVGLNGIVVSPQGFLLVDDGRAGALYKVSLANPKDVTRVKIDHFFPGADGLILSENNTLVLIQNKSVDKIFQLNSTDGWATANIKAATAATDRFQQPSTGAIYNGKVYVLNSKLNELADPTKKPSVEFSLQEAVFRPVQ